MNHVSSSRGGIIGIYHRHDWAAEKRAALDGWAAHVLAAVAGARRLPQGRAHAAGPAGRGIGPGTPAMGIQRSERSGPHTMQAGRCDRRNVDRRLAPAIPMLRQCPPRSTSKPITISDARAWWAESEDVPGLVSEAPTLDALVERVAGGGAGASGCQRHPARGRCAWSFTPPASWKRPDAGWAAPLTGSCAGCCWTPAAPACAPPRAATSFGTPPSRDGLHGAARRGEPPHPKRRAAAGRASQGVLTPSEGIGRSADTPRLRHGFLADFKFPYRPSRGALRRRMLTEAPSVLPSVVWWTACEVYTWVAFGRAQAERVGKPRASSATDAPGCRAPAWERPRSAMEDQRRSIQDRASGAGAGGSAALGCGAILPPFKRCRWSWPLRRQGAVDRWSGPDGLSWP